MSSVSGSRGVLMFVPRSVELRRRGLRRVPGQYNTWIPEAALEELQESKKRAMIRQKFSEAMRTDPVLVSLYSGMRWGDVIMGSDEAHDAPYVAMSSDEWIAEMKASRITKKWSRSAIIRIQNAREEKRKSKPIVVPERSRDADYKYWKNEYTNFGYLYFSSEEAQKEALEDLEERYAPKTNTVWALLD